MNKQQTKQCVEDNELKVDFNDVLDAITTLQDESPNVKLPSPSLMEFYNNQKNRVLWIQTIIDGGTLDIVKAIMQYNIQDKDIAVEKRKPIKLFIDTNGGNTVVMWSLIQAMKMSKTPIWTINFCEAMSAGAHILAAGHKRFGMPGSTVLIHSGSCAYSGTQEQAESAKKYYDGIDKKANEQLLLDTNIDPKILKKRSPFDWYISDEEAVQYGIIDKIITSFDEIV